MQVKVFLDTNVIISGLLTDEGIPKIVLDLFSLDLHEIKVVTGQFNLLELKRTIRNKIPVLAETFEDALRKINLEIAPLPEKEMVDRYKDLISLKDAPALASAIKLGCAYFITGDKHFRTEKLKKAKLPIRIVTPLEFMDIAVKIITPSLEK
jgi:predicted nucleic acid-binding protein